MTLAQSLPYAPDAFSSAEVAALVSIASRVVPPLWPLESAIAVNPLAGLEDLDFASALRKAGPLFGHHPGISLGQWRGMLDTGRIDRRVLRKVAAEWLGGLQAETLTLAPGISAVDLLMTRLLDLPDASSTDGPVAEPSPAAAFIAKWCAAYCDEAAVLPMPDREQGLYVSVIGIAAADPEFRRLSGARWGSRRASARL